MYSALWRILPGPLFVRILILMVLIAAVLFSLIEWVFPWVNAMLPISEATVGQ